MHAFLVFGMPLGFLVLALSVYPRAEFTATRRAFLLGLAAALPVWLAARLLGSLVPQAIGSALLALHEWADRILPYAALPAAGYAVFYRYGERLPPGAAARRLTAFYAGALAPVGLGEMTRVWANPEPYGILVLPILLGAIVLAMPRVALTVRDSYGFGLVLSLAGAAAASLAASLCPWLFLARLWPLGWLLAAAVGAGAWLLAAPELLRRPPAELAE